MTRTTGTMSTRSAARIKFDVDSIPTGNGAEDHVSMSTWAARKCRKVVELATRVLALELLVAAQANEWRVLLPDPSLNADPPDEAQQTGLEAAFRALGVEQAARELGRGSAGAYRRLRELSARVVEDRSLWREVEAVAQDIATGGFVAATGGLTVPVRRSRFEPG